VNREQLRNDNASVNSALRPAWNSDSGGNGRMSLTSPVIKVSTSNSMPGDGISGLVCVDRVRLEGVKGSPDPATETKADRLLFKGGGDIAARWMADWS